MSNWTVQMVEKRLIEAASVMRRLPPVRVPGYFNTWPAMMAEFADRVGQEPQPMRLPPPSSAAITRMEETLSWLPWLDPVDAKIVWRRACGERWKSVCWNAGLERAAANEHWQYALCVIAWRLNGRRVAASGSRRSFIATVRRSATSVTERHASAR